MSSIKGKQKEFYFLPWILSWIRNGNNQWFRSKRLEGYLMCIAKYQYCDNFERIFSVERIFSAGGCYWYRMITINQSVYWVTCHLAQGTFWCLTVWNKVFQTHGLVLVEGLIISDEYKTAILLLFARDEHPILINQFSLREKRSQSMSICVVIVSNQFVATLSE
jgi:hypothetical protein